MAETGWGGRLREPRLSCRMTGESALLAGYFGRRCARDPVGLVTADRFRVRVAGGATTEIALTRTRMAKWTNGR